jgi:hypothetical protein
LSIHHGALAQIERIIPVQRQQLPVEGLDLGGMTPAKVQILRQIGQRLRLIIAVQVSLA